MDVMDTFKSGHLFYTWKARVGIYLALKALDLQPGDEVILPGYTCVVVANAILYNGCKPVYADIDPATFNATAQKIEALITPRTRAILAQNTYGLSPDIDPILDLARPRGLFVIEDCTQGLGGSYKGIPNGLCGDAAVYSTQWSKPVSTGLGGILWVRDSAFAARVAACEQELSQPSLGDDLFLALQRLVRPLADRPRLHYGLVELYRFLTRKLGIVGSAARNELFVVSMPEKYLQRMGRFQKKAVEKAFEALPALTGKRQESAAVYDAFFTSHGLPVPVRPVYAVHSMLRYTVRVPDKTALLEKARRLHIELGDWFVSPLHPVESDLAQWYYSAGSCPLAEKACRETVNLPTDRPLSADQLQALFLDP